MHNKFQDWPKLWTYHPVFGRFRDSEICEEALRIRDDALAGTIGVTKETSDGRDRLAEKSAAKRNKMVLSHAQRIERGDGFLTAHYFGREH
jgi:hypothetical protein